MAIATYAVRTIVLTGVHIPVIGAIITLLTGSESAIAASGLAYLIAGMARTIVKTVITTLSWADLAVAAFI